MNGREERRDGGEARAEEGEGEGREGANLQPWLLVKKRKRKREERKGGEMRSKSVPWIEGGAGPWPRRSPRGTNLERTGHEHRRATTHR